MVFILALFVEETAAVFLSQAQVDLEECCNAPIEFFRLGLFSERLVE